MIRLSSLLVAVFLFAQSVFPAVHVLPYNVRTTLNLNDGDTLSLTGFPTGWFYSRVILGVNSTPSVPLAGNLVINNCNHTLTPYYREISFAYTDEIEIKFSGSPKQMPIQWWVDTGTAFSVCTATTKTTRKDSIQITLKNFADSIYANKIKNYRDLNKLNSETIFKGSSGNFKIEQLPNWFYNRIYVQIEPMDGRELNGYSYAGKKHVKLSGWSTKFAIEQKNAYTPTFELAFPEYRKVKLKWWAEVKTPTEKTIEATETNIGKDSVNAIYSFEQTPYNNGKVHLTFAKRNFTDGKIPIIRRLSFNPQGPSQIDDLGVRGNIYAFDAHINIGDSVTLAIPLDFNYSPQLDSITIEHFIEEENCWKEEPVDSIVDNVAYFKVGHFSWFRTLCRKVTKAVVSVTAPATLVCSWASETCANIVDGIINGVTELGADALSSANNLIADAVDGIAWVWNLLESLACLDLDEFKEIFSLSKSSSWSVEQGTIPFDVLHVQGSIRTDDTSLIDILVELRNSNLIKLENAKDEACTEIDEICKWRATRKNFDVLLADAILAKMDSTWNPSQYGKAKYSYFLKDGNEILTDFAGNVYNFKDYFMTQSGLIENAAWFVSGMKSCYGLFNYSGSVVQPYIDLYNSTRKGSYTGTCRSILDMIVSDKIDYIDNSLDCPKFATQYISSNYSIFESHSEKLISISEAMVRVSLLAWLNKTDFRNFSLIAYKATYDGIRSWLELAGPLLDYNNIAIKAYGSIALYEYIHFGTENNLTMINSALNHHYGHNGGYSEGTGYSQYIWDDLTYVLSAMKDAYTKKGRTLKINGNFQKSPDHMFEFSRPVANVGFVPIEIDDGVTYNPDYRVWAKLKNDAKYLAMSNAHPLKPIEGKMNVLVPFGIPEADLYFSNENVLPHRGELWSDFQDGIGIISVENTNGDTVTLSMIAEKGNLWTRGQSHDQQDNLSITLANSRKGFILQDRGYTGFSARNEHDEFHRYNSHNVLTYHTGNGQIDNQAIDFSELRSRIYDFTGSFPGDLISTILAGTEAWWKIFGSSYDFRVEGGFEASILNNHIKDLENKIIGYTATTKIFKPETVYSEQYIDNNRTILYFGGNFWIIDRSSSAEMKWLGNSPLKGWENLNLKIYGSSLTALTGGDGSEVPVKQNSPRFDFPNKILSNYFYEIYDQNAKTYVTTYAVDDEGFAKTNVDCPKDYQCFENGSSNKRLIVPPRDSKFNVCEALPANECSGEIKSSGITMLLKVSPESWIINWVIDGDLTNTTNFGESKILSATVSRTNYSAKNLDGTIQNGKYTSPYLPAVPVLLLR